MRSLLKSAPPSALAATAMFAFTAVLIACVPLLPDLAQEVYSDHFLEPTAVLNLAIAAAASHWLSARAVDPEARPMWRIITAGIAFAALDDAIDMHDWIYDGVLTPLAGAVAGHDVFLGGDDVVVVGYATAFAAYIGWRFRRQLMRHRCMTGLFALAGLLVVSMAVCDESTGLLKHAEGPSEAAATALVLAAVCVATLQSLAKGEAVPEPQLAATSH